MGSTLTKIVKIFPILKKLIVKVFPEDICGWKMICCTFHWVSTIPALEMTSLSVSFFKSGVYLAPFPLRDPNNFANRETREKYSLLQHGVMSKITAQGQYTVGETQYARFLFSFVLSYRTDKAHFWASDETIRSRDLLTRMEQCSLFLWNLAFGNI